MSLCSIVLRRGLTLSSAFSKPNSLGGLPGLDHGFCVEMARGLLPLFWVQDCKICYLLSAARVLCGFNADAEQTALLSPARGLLSSESWETMGVLGRWW